MIDAMFTMEPRSWGPHRVIRQSRAPGGSVVVVVGAHLPLHHPARRAAAVEAARQRDAHHAVPLRVREFGGVRHLLADACVVHGDVQAAVRRHRPVVEGVHAARNAVSPGGGGVGAARARRRGAGAHEALWETSRTSAVTASPSSRSLAAADSATSACTSPMTTLAPARASVSAMPSPSPWAPGRQQRVKPKRRAPVVAGGVGCSPWRRR